MLRILPPTCFVTGDISKKSTIDVGICGQQKCISSSMVDNGTCTDWWPHHCCDVDVTETVHISCRDFQYKMVKIKSCKCRLCMKKTTVSGKAFGRENGNEVPMQLARICLNGHPVGSTNMFGYFKIDIKNDTERAILTFSDEIFKKFLDHTKLIDINEGIDNYVSVIIPMRPPPVPFDANNGMSVHVGGDTKGTSPAGSVSIPANSIVTTDGVPYKGRAKAVVHFMDPRRLDDMETATGDFVYARRNGERAPLRTYGILHVGLEDEHDNTLLSYKPFQFNLDGSLFNVNLDKNGNPDICVWYYDVNNGAWVEQNKMQFASAGNGRKRRLAGPTLVGNFTPVVVPLMDPYDKINYTKTVTQIVQNPSSSRINIDKRIEIEVVEVKDQLKDGVCYVSASIYTDLSFRELLKDGTAAVTAYSQDQDTLAYLGIETRTVDRDGHVCLTIFCNKLVHMYAEIGGVRLFPGKHFVPDIYPIRETNSMLNLTFESRVFGKAYVCPPGEDCKGPVYLFQEKDASLCTKTRSNKYFHFRFAPFTKEASLQTAIGSTNKYNEKLSWYPVSPHRQTFRSCFIKVQVKVSRIRFTYIYISLSSFLF